MSTSQPVSGKNLETTPREFYPIRVRKATEDDIAPLVTMMTQSAFESEGKELDPLQSRLAITRFLMECSLGHYFVAESCETGEMVASTFVTIEFSDWTNALYWWLQSVYILPEFRGKGVLDQVLDAIEAEAHASGVTQLRLYVYEDNKRAVRAYEKNNFYQKPYTVMVRDVGQSK